jgi:uncharacterized membrane protein YukC
MIKIADNLTMIWSLDLSINNHMLGSDNAIFLYWMKGGKAQLQKPNAF